MNRTADRNLMRTGMRIYDIPSKSYQEPRLSNRIVTKEEIIYLFSNLLRLENNWRKKIAKFDWKYGHKWKWLYICVIFGCWLRNPFGNRDLTHAFTVIDFNVFTFFFTFSFHSIYSVVSIHCVVIYLMFMIIIILAQWSIISFQLYILWAEGCALCMWTCVV